MDNLTQMIETLGITLSYVSAPFNPHMENSDKMFHWACGIFPKDKPLDGFNVMFSKGAGRLKVRDKVRPWMFYGQGIQPKEVKAVTESVNSFCYDFERKTFRKHFGSTTGTERIIANNIFEAEPPTAEEVLECLLMDASALDYDTFEDWADDLGYDNDSIKARDTFHFIRQQSKNLVKMLGRENFRIAREFEF